MLVFDLIENVPTKTKQYNIRTKNTPTFGTIKWYAQWRRYVFYPAPYTLLDFLCCQEITNKLRQLMDGRESL